jgi:putative tryptophan/tyrosine transport system substrate-binding protein
VVNLLPDGVGTGLTMRRREFVALLGSVTAAWPRMARAQQGEHVRLVYILQPVSADLPFVKAEEMAFLEGLRQLGWTPGRNVRIEWRWGGGDEATTRKYAAELIALAPDVIVASGSLGAEVMLKATHTIPIVFVFTPDPVGSGYVESVSRPGGNATGFMMFEYNLCGKWLELLKEIAPSVTHAAVLRDPGTPAGIGQFAVIQSVAPSVGIEVSPIDLREPDKIEPSIARFAQRSDGGIIFCGE